MLHCGDFGFYSEDEESLKRVPERELSLRISHSEHLPLDIRKKAFKFSREEKLALLLQYHLFGEFGLFVLGASNYYS